MLEKIWRYIVNDGEFGGIVFAENEKEAKEKVVCKYNRTDFLVWKMVNDEYFDSENHDALETYGM